MAIPFTNPIPGCPIHSALTVDYLPALESVGPCCMKDCPNLTTVTFDYVGAPRLGHPPFFDGTTLESRSSEEGKLVIRVSDSCCRRLHSNLVDGMPHSDKCEVVLFEDLQ